MNIRRDEIGRSMFQFYYNCRELAKAAKVLLASLGFCLDAVMPYDLPALPLYTRTKVLKEEDCEDATLLAGRLKKKCVKTEDFLP
jgi:hypothetical protein